MIVAMATVMVIVAGIIGWRYFGDALSERSSSAAEQCIKGTATVAVVADPSIADEVGEFLESYGRQASPWAIVA